MACDSNCVSTALFGCVCDTCDGGAILKILAMVIKIMTVGVGILAVIGVLIVGITYLTSAGDVAKTQKAKRRMLEIVIGLALYVVMFALLEFLIPGGVMQSSLDSSTSSCK